jgi:nitroreductase
MVKVIRGRAKLKRLSKRSGTFPGRAGDAPTSPSSLFRGAGTLMVVYAKPSGGRYSIGDCYLAAHDIMLAAHGMGIVSCSIGSARPWLDLDEVKGEFGIPLRYTAAFTLVLGYLPRNAAGPRSSWSGILN